MGQTIAPRVVRGELIRSTLFISLTVNSKTMKLSKTLMLAILMLISGFSSQILLAGLPPTDFSKPRAPGDGAYRFTTRYLTYASDGSKVSEERTILEIDLKIDGDGQQYLTCRSFKLQKADGSMLEIPQLSGYRNTMDTSSEQVLGVNHSDFLGLKTDDDAALTPDMEYRVYNTFVDFYAFNNVFAQPVESSTDKSIADLRLVGQKIVHHSAFSEPPVDMGDAVEKGSYFKNGEVTLEWKGSSTVNGVLCELVEFDSGESSFEMFMEPVPDMKLHVKGGSQYWGDLYINTTSLWVEEARFKELVILQFEMDDNPGSSSIIKRIGVIEKIDL